MQQNFCIFKYPAKLQNHLKDLSEVANKHPINIILFHDILREICSGFTDKKFDCLSIKDFPFLERFKDLSEINDKTTLFHYLFIKVSIENLCSAISESNRVLLGKIYSINEKISEKLAQLLSLEKNLESLAMHYILHIISYINDENLDEDIMYLDDIFTKIHSFDCPVEIQQNLKNYIFEIALDEDILKIYEEIDNCFQGVFDLEQTKVHLIFLIKDIFEKKKIHFINDVSDNDKAETVFDGSIYIQLNELHYIEDHKEFLETQNKKKQMDIYKKLLITILHELSHCKRIKYSSKNNFLKTTPDKKFKAEIGEFFEQKFENFEHKFFSMRKRQKTKKGNHHYVKCATKHHPKEEYEKREKLWLEFDK